MTIRRAHILQPLSDNPIPNQCIWFDTETHQHDCGADTVYHTLWFGYAWYRRRLNNNTWTAGDWLRFTSKSQFYDWVESHTRPKTKLYMFCHNTNFDLPVMDVFHQLPERGWQLEMSVIEAPPTILRWRRNTHSIVMLDTLNIFTQSLKSLGDMIGLPKLDMPKVQLISDAWEVYGKRDTEIISKACIQWWNFISENDLGGFAPTLAGQALRSYRHRFMPAKIYIDSDETALKLARQAYLGGRCEAYFIGEIKEEVSCLDVNSMYPYVMKEYFYPNKLVGTTLHASIDDCIGWSKDKCLVAHVSLKTDKPAYPIKRDKKLIWPVGEFDAVLTTPELSLAVESGHIVSINQVAVYTRAKLFEDYVTWFYNARLDYKNQGNKVYANMCKNLLTNLYGKFGQAGLVYETDQWIDTLDSKQWTEIDADTGDVIKWRQLGGLLQRRREEGESRESHPAITAHVTAYARRHLYMLQCLAGREKVLYSDTDSIYVRGQPNDDLKIWMSDTQIGFLKLEGVEQSMTIHGPKDYTFGPKFVLKGSKFNALWTDKNTFEQDRWSGLRGLLSRNELDKPTTARVIKHLKREYNKGVVEPGGLILPYYLMQ